LFVLNHEGTKDTKKKKKKKKKDAEFQTAPAPGSPRKSPAPEFSP
jgi:hypothetical protein